MSTYLDLAHTSFADVTISNEGVDTDSFLKASDGLVAMFDLMDNFVLNTAKNDICGNIKTVRAKYNEAPIKYGTLEILGGTGAGTALRWLLRGLALAYYAMKYAQDDPNKEIITAFQESYDITLRQHHNFVIGFIVKPMMNALPSRVKFYKIFGSPPERVNRELNEWLRGLGEILNRMKKYY